MLRGLVVLFFYIYCDLLQAQAVLTEPSADVISLQSLQVVTTLSAVASGVTDLKFSELYKMPVGPRGIEPSAKLLSLDKKLVRIVGYMAKQETPTLGLFIVTPLPVNMGDEDDMFADDMPANSIFVHLENPNALVRYTAGLIQFTGLLSIGSMTEVDGRVSSVRVQMNGILSGLANIKHQASNK